MLYHWISSQYTVIQAPPHRARYEYSKYIRNAYIPAVNKLSEIIWHINRQILQRLTNHSLHIPQLPGRSNLPRPTHDNLALRINNAKVPPSAIRQTSAPNLHRLIPGAIPAIVRVESHRHKQLFSCTFDARISEYRSSIAASVSSRPFGKVGKYGLVGAFCSIERLLEIAVFFVRVEIDVFDCTEFDWIGCIAAVAHVEKGREQEFDSKQVVLPVLLQ